MTIHRAKIMQDAWTIARRFAGNKETWGQRLSRALKSVWRSAKEKALQAAAMAEHRDRYLLGWVVRDMERGPRLSGQAVGFLAVFADMARFANMLATGKAEALQAEAKEAKGQAA